MNLFYVTFGASLECHYQASFSMLTFLKEEPKPSITVITDRPQFYEHLKTFVDIWEVSPATIREWRGKHDYIYRIKIKGFEKLEEKFPDKPLMYLDADTFLYGKLSDLGVALTGEKAFMYRRQGALSELTMKTERAMWAGMKNRAFAGLTIQSHHAMWDAGVIMLPGPKNKQTIATTLRMCDEVCDIGVPHRLVEQFSFSATLQHTHNLQPANPWICHYWGNKPGWNETIMEFFLQSHMNNWSLDDQLERVRAFDFSATPYVRKRSSTHKRLVTLVNKLYPFKDVEHLK